MAGHLDDKLRREVARVAEGRQDRLVRRRQVRRTLPRGDIDNHHAGPIARAAAAELAQLVQAQRLPAAAAPALGVVDHHLADLRQIDTHADGTGGHQHVERARAEIALGTLPIGARAAGVVKAGAEPRFRERGRHGGGSRAALDEHQHAPAQRHHRRHILDEQRGLVFGALHAADRPIKGEAPPGRPVGARGRAPRQETSQPERDLLQVAGGGAHRQHVDVRVEAGEAAEPALQSRPARWVAEHVHLVGHEQADLREPGDVGGPGARAGIKPLIRADQQARARERHGRRALPGRPIAAVEHANQVWRERVAPAAEQLVGLEPQRHQEDDPRVGVGVEYRPCAAQRQPGLAAAGRHADHSRAVEQPQREDLGLRRRERGAVGDVPNG